MTKARLAYLKFKLIAQLLFGAWCVYFASNYLGIPGWIGWPAGFAMILFVIMFDDKEQETRNVIAKPFSDCD